MTSMPDDRLLRGELGRPIYVLSLPDIRSAEILTSTKVLQTADGDVTGRPGDVVVTAYGGERYPIPSEIFFGTYEVIGQVGNRLVARRLIHVRTAWPVISADAEFDYGADRGIVAVSRGGWLYQSDFDDYGIINPSVEHRGHVEVGEITDVEHVDWRGRFERMAWFLAFLPSALSLLALLAVHLREGSPRWIPAALTIADTLLLLIGVGCVTWMHMRRWGLKAAVSAGATLASDYQSAVRALGEKSSTSFPHMALWRSAQVGHLSASHQTNTDRSAKRTSAELRQQIARTLADIEVEVGRNHRIERLARISEIVAIVVAIGSNIWMLLNPAEDLLKLLSIWLPTLIGALHSFIHRRRSAERATMLVEFTRQLGFIKTELQTIGTPTVFRPTAETALAEESVLRLLCKVIAQYCQEELKLAINQRPPLPI